MLGVGAFGQLGDGKGMSSSSPVQVIGLASSVTAITAGNNTTCAVQSGVAWCWGRSDFGQLGDGNSTRRLTPVRVKGLGSSVTVITVGDKHTCAVQSGAAWCWGSGAAGQLGDGQGTQSFSPVQVDGLDSGVTAIAAGGDGQTGHTCALQYGFIKCWGLGDDGRLGVEGTTSLSNVPVQVTGLALVPPTRLRAGTVTGYSIAISWNMPSLAEDVPIAGLYNFLECCWR